MRTLTGLLLWCTLASAGDLSDFTRSCFHRADLNKGKYWLEECVEQFFTLEPVHPAIYTIAPGTGPAFGAGMHMTMRTGRWEFVPSALAVVSSDRSYMLETQMVIAGPPVSLGYTWKPESAGSGHQHGRRVFGLVSDSAGVDAKWSLAIRARRFEAAEQNFFGIGPNSVRAGLAPYSLRRNEIGAALNDPLTFWSSIGVTADFIAPRTGPAPEAAASANIGKLYDDTSAPGLGSRNNYLRFEPYIDFRLPVRGANFVRFKTGYEIYHDLDGGRFSFNRLSAIARGSYEVKLPSHKSPRERSRVANFLCTSLRSRQHCTPAQIDLTGMADIAYTKGTSRVPFYFDETLGGSDITGNDTLRGFVDYRFRGPSRVLFQAEVRHPVWGPLGLLTFYDIGKVGVLPSSLSLDHMRHDIGVGMYLQAANRVVLRVYVGFGSGEGTRPNYKLPAAY